MKLGGGGEARAGRFLLVENEQKLSKIQRSYDGLLQGKGRIFARSYR